MMLAAKNPHPRDERVRFVDETHTYYIDGSSDGYLSCTTFIHGLFGKFDADAIITKMMKSPKFAIGDYAGMTREEIKAKWDKNRDEAAAAGTAMHLNLEMYYNDEPHVENTKEWDLFCSYQKDFPDYKAYRTEMIVFAEDLKIAGSIDMVYHDPEEPGSYIICDWKRSKEIKMNNRFQKGCSALTRDLDDCNLVHYSLQLNLYKYILHNYYDMKVNAIFLCVLHPNQDTYLKIEGLDLYDRIEALMRERRAKIERSHGVTPPPNKKPRVEVGDGAEDDANKENIPPSNM
ncbi:FirrV-1-A45 [Tribonema minus]|uniref:FirrV-1-A45 n=1 Tax=Tribonema minus TaxID=303371 RepID=A0A835Z5Z5_9STRA|nr:FirrV-1-A45 [Tribonema minus]